MKQGRKLSAREARRIGRKGGRKAARNGRPVWKQDYERIVGLANSSDLQAPNLNSSQIANLMGLMKAIRGDEEPNYPLPTSVLRELMQ